MFLNYTIPNFICIYSRSFICIFTNENSVSMRTHIAASQVNSFVSEAERNTATQLREQLERAEGSPELEREVLPRMFDPMYSPLFVESLAELPPAYVVTAGRDIFRDEALAYVRRMRHAKEHSTVAHRHYTNDVHGFMTLDGSNRLQRDLADFLDAHPYFL